MYISNNDIRNIVSKLRAEFREKTKPLGNKNERGTKLHKYQVDFCYIVDNIQRGPIFAIPFLIADGEKLIKSIA